MVKCFFYIFGLPFPLQLFRPLIMCQWLVIGFCWHLAIRFSIFSFFWRFFWFHALPLLHIYIQSNWCQIFLLWAGKQNTETKKNLKKMIIRKVKRKIAVLNITTHVCSNKKLGNLFQWKLLTVKICLLKYSWEVDGSTLRSKIPIQLN